jgi:hypothetical protein
MHLALEQCAARQISLRKYKIRVVKLILDDGGSTHL